MKNLLANKILWTATALLALISAIAGVIRPEIYDKVLAKSLAPATMAQDILTIVVSAILICLIFRIKENQTKLQLTILGIIGSMGYLYAIFSIERVYTILYLAYLAILSLTIYTLPFSIACIKDQKWEIPKPMKIISVGFSIIIAILFSFLWIGALIPVMKTGQKIELYYSIYILDLVWVMPGFLITAILSIRNKSIGFLLTPAMYILGIFVIFPLGLGELAKPFYGTPVDIQSMVMSFVLSGAFLVLSAIQLALLKRSDS